MKQIWLTLFFCLLNPSITSLSKPQWKSDLYFQPMHACAFRNINQMGFYFILMMNMIPQKPHKQNHSLPLRGSMTCFEILWNIWYFHKGKCLNNFLVFWISSCTFSPFLKKNLKQIGQSPNYLANLLFITKSFFDHFLRKRGKYVSCKENKTQALIYLEIILGFGRTYIWIWLWPLLCD